MPVQCHSRMSFARWVVNKKRTRPVDGRETSTRPLLLFRAASENMVQNNEDTNVSRKHLQSRADISEEDIRGTGRRARKRWQCVSHHWS